MEMKEITLDGVGFTLPIWGLRKALENMNYFLPLIEGPIINGIALGEEESDSITMAAIVSGIMDGIQAVDILAVSEKAFEGGAVSFPGEPKKSLSLDVLEANDVSLATIYLVIAAVVKMNYGSVLKKDLEGSLSVIMDL